MKRWTVFWLTVAGVALGAWPLGAQVYIPYYGKNQVHYDHFRWKVYKTEHFDIYFYPEAAYALPTVAGIAESAYQKIYRILQTAPPFRIPLIYYRNQAEYEQINYLQDVTGSLGVAEPVYNRMAFPIDMPPDLLQDVITHELAHIFEFAIMFGQLGGRAINLRVSPPAWVWEGFADYATGRRDPFNTMIVRDAVLTERLPYVSATRELEVPAGSEITLPQYTLGSFIWEFIRDRFGEAGIRQFWFQLRKMGFLGGADPFLAAFGVTEQRFNELFADYLRNRFRDFLDREPAFQYHRVFELPYPYRNIMTYAISPDGRYVVVGTVNIYDYDLDILVLDRQGRVVRNLTPGYTTAFQNFPAELPPGRFDMALRSLTWSPDGQRVAFFARTGKYQSLFVMDVRGRKLQEIYIPLNKTASPAFHPDGRHLSFTAYDREGRPTIFLMDLVTRKYEPLTQDETYKETPVWVENGKALLYVGRQPGRSAIYRLDLATRQVTRVGPAAPWYFATPTLSPDGRYLVFSADIDGALDLYRMDLQSGEIVRMTRAMGGNFSPTVVAETDGSWVYFIGFFKGQLHLYRVGMDRQLAVVQLPAEATQVAEAASELPRLNIDPAGIQKKGFRPVLGAPPTLIGGADQFTYAFASAITFEDILGDQAVTVFLQRISSFNTFYASYLDRARRFQYLTELFWADTFFIGPIDDRFIDFVKDSVIGGDVFGYYPLSLWSRIELGLGFFRIRQKFLDPFAQALHEAYLRRTGARDFLINQWDVPVTLAYTFETTRFWWFGPLSGQTGRIAVIYSLPLSQDFIRRTTLYGDYRRYFRLSRFSLLAVRLQGFLSTGERPYIFVFGGGLSFRGFDFRELIGNRGAVANLEYRFPLFPAAWRRRTPALEAFRARLFADAGVLRLNEDVFFIPISRSGFDVTKGVGSFGAGVTVFFGGLPLNLDLSYTWGRPLAEPNARYRIDTRLRFDFSIGYPF